MSETSDAALHLLAMLGDDSKLKPKLDEFIKRKTLAEAAEKQLEARQSEHDSAKAEIDRYALGKQGEMNELQMKLDESNKEMARRIELNNAQLDRMGKWEADLHKLSADLTRRAADLERRERAVAQREAQLDAASEALMQRKRELDDRHERLRAAMA